MSEQLKALNQKVRDNNNLEQSITTIVQGVADALDGLTQDPVAIKQLATDLRNMAPEIAASAITNTQTTPGAPATTNVPSTVPAKAPTAPSPTKPATAVPNQPPSTAGQPTAPAKAPTPPPSPAPAPPKTT
jgi:hypothetical protein